MDWLYLITFVITMARYVALKTFYIFPDNSTNVSCSPQHCGTLSQYLLNNNTLPAVSNAEYHFLPGEYYISANIEIKNVSNVSISGITYLTPVKFVCLSQSFVAVLHSYIIKKFVFKTVMET